MPDAVALAHMVRFACMRCARGSASGTTDTRGAAAFTPLRGARRHAGPPRSGAAVRHRPASAPPPASSIETLQMHGSHIPCNACMHLLGIVVTHARA